MKKVYGRLMIGGLMGLLLLSWTATETSARASRPVSAPEVQRDVIALVNVSVVPMDTERVLKGQTVLVEGGWITAVGPMEKIAVPAGATRIDGKGKYLIPGLADMHAHLDASTGRDSAAPYTENMLFLMVANGVTTVRVMGKWPEYLRLRQRATAGELIGPRLYIATGLYLRGGLQTTMDSLAADKARGFDFIKAKMGNQPGNMDEKYKAMIIAARNMGVPVAGHIHPKLAIEGGAASMEHLDGMGEAIAGVTLMQAGSDPQKWFEIVKHPIDTTKLRTLIAALKEAGVWSCPTQLMHDMMMWPADSMESWPEMRYVSPKVRQYFRSIWSVNAPADSLPAAIPVVRARRQVIKALHDAGAGLLLGTDASRSTHYLVPGFSVHRELGALVRAGLTPYEALVTGTRNVALFMGTLDSAGTIAVGKRADLVLLNGNPLEDIRRTSEITGVMLRGRWFSRDELDRRLKTLEGSAF